MVACNILHIKRWFLTGTFIAMYLLLPLLSSAQAEDNTPIRIEFESGKDWYEYNYLPLGDQGVMIINRGKLIHPDTVLWSFTFYDTNFVKKNNIEIKALSNLLLAGSHFSGEDYYFLFQTSSGRKVPTRSFILTGNTHNIDTKENQYTYSEIFPDLISVSQISAVDHHLFLFSTEKENHAICFYDLAAQKVTKKIDLGNNYTEFVVLDTASQKVLIATNEYTNPDGSIGQGFMLYESNYEGSALIKTPFPQYEQYQYKSARLAKTGPGSYLIIGTYNNQTDKKPSNLHSGVYTIVYENSKINYPNFFNYTSLKTKDSKAIAKAQNNNLNLQLVIGDVYSNDQQYGFITEVYYPEYTTTNYYAPGSYYVSTPVSTFEGYRFLNAYVTTFDKRGNLLWDHFMPINEMLTQSLDAKVGLFIDRDNNGYIYYPYGNTITSTLVNNYTILEPILTEKISSMYQKDIIESTMQIKLERWYGDTFILTGYQSIRNSNYGKSGKRFVFFMNRIQYR